MSAKLVAEEGLLKELVLSLDEGDQWTIGRDPDACQIVIEDPSASREHLVCRSTAKGIVLENLSTTNPVQVNDEELKEPYTLQHGDMVKIGDSTFRFYSGTAAHVLNDEVPQPEEEEEDLEESAFEEETATPPPGADISFDLLETGRWLLKVLGGPNTGAEFSMQTGMGYLIGTDPNSCDIVFHDTSVSRQHARITIDKRDNVTIQDLNSRNGVMLNGDRVRDTTPLEPNKLVTMGTTSFVVYDREGEMQTIISPLLPSIIEKLKKDKEEEKPKSEEEKEEIAEVKPKDATQNAIGGFILIGILTGLFVIVGIGVTTLFQSEPVGVEQEFNEEEALTEIFAPFPTIKYSFNKSTGRLLMLGHVLSSTDKSQMRYSVQALPFVKTIDDSGVVVDEYVWKQSNAILNKDPRWKGINIHSPKAGSFVVSGYLKTRKEAEELSDYLTANFPYLDLLEQRITVEEDVVNSIALEMQRRGIQNIKIQMRNGEVTLTGGISKDQEQEYNALVKEFQKIPGIRQIKDFTTKLAPEKAIVDVSERYEVSGFSSVGGKNFTVVVNGKFLQEGDYLDGMKITKITRNMILLEKDGVKYRIEHEH